MGNVLRTNQLPRHFPMNYEPHVQRDEDAIPNRTVRLHGRYPHHHRRQIVHQVLDKLEKESYFLRPAKCEFEKEKVDYLGVIISRERIHIDPLKVEGLRNWPQKLDTLKQVRSTLGILGYQRPFIPGFAHITRPLTNLLKKGTSFL